MEAAINTHITALNAGDGFQRKIQLKTANGIIRDAPTVEDG